MAVHGAKAPHAASAGIGRSDDDDAVEKEELRRLKRKLPIPKDGWKDAKGVTLRAHVDKNFLFQQLFDIMWKLRDMVREHAAAAHDATNVAEKACGVKRTNLSDPEEYSKKLENMLVCQALELGINQLHEDGCSLYIRHTYN
jgi:hypothetical protein